MKFSISPVNSPKNISLCYDGERDVNTNVLQYYNYHVINVKVSCSRSDLVIYIVNILYKLDNVSVF